MTFDKAWNLLEWGEGRDSMCILVDTYFDTPIAKRYKRGW